MQSAYDLIRFLGKKLGPGSVVATNYQVHLDCQSTNLTVLGWCRYRPTGMKQCLSAGTGHHSGLVQVFSHQV
jgi:hypothetical protein